MKLSRFLVGTLALVLVAGIGVPAYATILLGPIGGTGLSGEYATSTDSPFIPEVDFSGEYFHLEDFEDALLNTPGVSGNNGGVTSVVFGSSNHDSVDLDDGVLDGSGLAGDSWFFSSGATGVTFTFNAAVLGNLPTHVGIVWTDGVGTTTFEAFGPGMVSLGTIGPVAIADGSTSGTTAEDRFFGIEDPNGILAIKLSNTGGGIELDHVQYGFMPESEPQVVGGDFIPIDSTALLLAGLQTSAIWMLPILAGAAGAGFAAFRLRHRF